MKNFLILLVTILSFSYSCKKLGGDNNYASISLESATSPTEKEIISSEIVEEEIEKDFIESEDVQMSAESEVEGQSRKKYSSRAWACNHVPYEIVNIYRFRPVVFLLPTDALHSRLPLSLPFTIPENFYLVT